MSNLSIRVKLCLIFAVIIALIALLIYQPMRDTGRIQDEAQDIKQEHLPVLAFSSQISEGILALRLKMRDYVAAPTDGKWKDTLQELENVVKIIQQAAALSKKNPENTVFAASIVELTTGGAAYGKTCEELHAAIEVAEARLATVGQTGDAFIEAVNTALADPANTPEERSKLRSLTTAVLSLRVDVLTALAHNDLEQLLKLEAQFRIMGTTLKDLEKTMDANPATATYPQVEGAYKGYYTAFSALGVAWKKQREIYAKLAELAARGSKAVEQMQNHARESAFKGVNGTMSVIDDARSMLLKLGIACLLVCLAVAVFMAYDITSSLNRCLRTMLVIAEGDYTARCNLPRGDEFGRLAKAINTAFDRVVHKVHWFEDILNALPFPLITMDQQRAITFVNAHAQPMFKSVQGNPEGKPCHVWNAAICKTQNCAIECCERGQKDVEFYQPGEGHFRAMAVRLNDPKGNHVGYVDMVFDISEEKRLAQEAENAVVAGRMAAAQKLEKVVEHVSTASVQLSAQVQQSDRAAADTSARMGQTASAVEQLNIAVLEVARHASSASEASQAMCGRAEDGAKLVTHVVTGMDHVQTQALSLKNDMEALGQQAENIGQILTTISDIADQTNLLALNAAIEAARAGDAGRGFAVVADEVRKLAENTMQATREVGEAITAIQASSRKNMLNVDEAVQAIQSATSIATQSGEALHEILTLATGTSDKVRLIATSAEEQSSTSQEITVNVEEVHTIARQLSEGMGEANTAVQGLADQAQRLAALIDDLKRG